MPISRFAWVLLLALALPPLAGCKKSSASGQTHESVVVAAVASMQAIADALKSVRDAASAKQATDVLNREIKNLRRLRQSLVDLGSATKAQRERVKQHSDKIVAASRAVTQSSQAVIGQVQAGQVPRETATPLLEASKEYGEAMSEFADQAKPLLN